MEGLLLLIFSGITMMIVVEGRMKVWREDKRVLLRDKQNCKTRKEILDEVDQKEWEVYLNKKYSTFPPWYGI